MESQVYAKAQGVVLLGSTHRRAHTMFQVVNLSDRTVVVEAAHLDTPELLGKPVRCAMTLQPGQEKDIEPIPSGISPDKETFRLRLECIGFGTTFRLMCPVVITETHNTGSGMYHVELLEDAHELAFPDPVWGNTA